MQHGFTCRKFIVVTFMHYVGPLVISSHSYMSVWSNMQQTTSAHLLHLVATWVSIRMECASAVLFTIFKTECYSHYLIIFEKRDLCTDGQGNEHYCCLTPFLCEQISCFIQKNEDKMSRSMKTSAQNFMCKNDDVTPSLKI